ncbi:MAG: TonB-dependent siderophore receptor [Vicinamibacterales bacterium]
MNLRSVPASLAALACVAMLGIAPAAAAQEPTSISGSVVDQSGGAVVDAAVTVVSIGGTGQFRTTTDSRGAFSVSNLPPGRYVVRVEQKLFTPARLDVDVVDGVVAPPVRVVLAVSGLSEVVDIQAPGGFVSRAATTATKTDVPLFDIPVAASIVPRAILDQQKTASLKDVLQNVSSVQAENGGSAGNQFIIRGFSNGGVVLRDSLNAVTAAGYRTDFDDYNIERVEVLKGPGSVLFGRAQPGGTINLITSSAQAEPSLSVEQRLGSFDQRRTVVHATGPMTKNKTLLVRVDAVYEDSHSFRDYVMQGRKGFNPRVTWRPSDATVLTASYERVRMDYQFDRGQVAIGTRPADLPIGRALFGDPANDTDFFNQSYSSTEFRRRLARGWTIRHRYLRSVRDSTDVELNAISSTTPLLADGRTLPRGLFSQVSDTDLHTTNLDLMGDFFTGRVRHRTLVGYDFLRDFTNYSAAGLFNTAATVNPALNLDIFAPVYTLTTGLFAQALDNALNGVHNYSVFWNKNSGVYVQDQLTLPRRIHVLLGGRYDWANTARGNGASLAAAAGVWQSQKRHDEAFSPRVGAVYQPVTWLGVYTSFTRSFGSNNGISATGEVFPPQRGEQVEGGVKTEWFGGTLSATVAAFHLKQTNLLIANLATPDPTDVVLAGDRRSKGIELDLLGKVSSHLSATASYAYTGRAWVAGDNPPSLGGVAGNLLPNVPRHRGTFWLSYGAKTKTSEPMQFGLGVLFSGKRFGDIQNSFELPGYVRLDGSAGYTFKAGRSRLTVQLNARNLFNTKYYEYASNRTSIIPGTPRAVLLSTAVAF